MQEYSFNIKFFYYNTNRIRSLQLLIHYENIMMFGFYIKRPKNNNIYKFGMKKKISSFFFCLFCERACVFFNISRALLIKTVRIHFNFIFFFFLLGTFGISSSHVLFLYILASLYGEASEIWLECASLDKLLFLMYFL